MIWSYRASGRECVCGWVGESRETVALMISFVQQLSKSRLILSFSIQISPIHLIRTL